MKYLNELRIFFLILTIILGGLMILFITSPVAVLFSIVYLIFLSCFGFFHFLKKIITAWKKEREIRSLLK